MFYDEIDRMSTDYLGVDEAIDRMATAKSISKKLAKNEPMRKRMITFAEKVSAGKISIK